MTDITWYKRFHGTAYDPKFTAVATEAGSTHCNALAIWDALLEETSGNDEDRGSLTKVDLRVVAAGLHLAIAEVQRIWQAFISLGMIAGERVAKWAKRQGAAAAKLAEAVTSGAVRMRRYRAKKAPDPRQLNMKFVINGGLSEASPTVTKGSSVTSPSAVERETDRDLTPLEAPPPGGRPTAIFSIDDEGVEVLPPAGKVFHGRRRRSSRPSFDELWAAGLAASRAARMERARMAGGVDPQHARAAASAA